jgi:4-hydroxythreonine-4-phosphate dehydrogenase
MEDNNDDRSDARGERMTDSPIIGITMGDPAGIGAEVVAKAYPKLQQDVQPIVIGDRDVVQAAVDVCNIELDVDAVRAVDAVEPSTDTIPVLDLDNVEDLEYGDLREEYGTASLEYVEQAIDLALDGEINAIVTAPINKQATRLAGSTHAGHTGLLAERTDTQEYSMMLIEGDLRVTHVSTHVSLPKACDLVTKERVLSTINVTHDALHNLGIDDPDIAVAGLNPHASDGGLLGKTDGAEIRPAVEAAREQEIRAIGPESPDTVYVRAARGEFDCVVSMYHDQGHIPIKMLGFSESGAVSGVNMTIGLPIVRTSVDHGTAFDIAGDGVASPDSLIDAVSVAVQATTATSE